MRRTGSVLTSLLSVSPQGSVEVVSSTKFSLDSCSQSSNSCDVSLCTSCDSPVVSVDPCSGFPRSPPSVPPLLSHTGFSISLFSLFADIDSCEEDGEGVDEDVGEEELAR